MLVKILKTLGYYLPYKDTHVYYKLKNAVYLRFVKNLMKFNYGKCVQKTINGIQYELDLSEAIESSLYYSGVYELETLKCLQKYIHKDMVVFEIGANIGSHSFEIAKILNPGAGKVYCFEPTEYAFHKFMNNYRLNSFHNIIVEKLALSDQEYSQTITPTQTLDTMAFTASWDIKDRESKNRIPQEIRFTRLDTYVAENAIPHIDLLKIDVDGYELKVLKGGKHIINQCKPVIIIELSACMLHYIGDTLEELLALLSSMEYCFQPVYSQRQMAVPEIIEHVKDRQSLDCLCLHNPA